jgi:hypothetical protein
MPFEDLLVSGPPTTAAGIPRSAIEPTWAFFSATEPEAIETLQRQLREILGPDPLKTLQLGEQLWKLGAAVLDRDWPQAPDAMPMIRNALLAAAEIEAFKRACPVKPLSSFDSEAIGFVSGALKQLLGDARPLDAFLLVIAARMTEAAQLLPILQEHQIPVPSAVASKLDALAVTRLATRAEWFERKAEELSTEDIAREADKLVRSLAVTRESVGGPARVKLEREAKSLSQAVRGALKTRVIDAAVPTIAPALTSDQYEAWAAAEAHARALRRSRHTASQLGLGPAADASVSQLHDTIVTRINESSKAMKNAESGDADAKQAQAEFFRAVRILELVEGSKSALPYLKQGMAIPTS